MCDVVLSSWLMPSSPLSTVKVSTPRARAATGICGGCSPPPPTSSEPHPNQRAPLDCCVARQLLTAIVQAARAASCIWPRPERLRVSLTLALAHAVACPSPVLAPRVGRLSPLSGGLPRLCVQRPHPAANQPAHSTLCLRLHLCMEPAHPQHPS